MKKTRLEAFYYPERKLPQRDDIAPKKVFKNDYFLLCNTFIIKHQSSEMVHTIVYMKYMGHIELSHLFR